MKSVTKHSPGKYKVRITWVDAAGKRHDTERVVDANNAPQARIEREKLRLQLAGTGDEWTVREAADKWREGMRPTTARARKSHLARLVERFGDKRLSTVPTPDLQRLIATLPVSDRTASHHLDTYRGLYQWARAQGRLRGDDPTLTLVRRVTPKTDTDLLELLEAPATRKALMGDEIPRFFQLLLEQEPEVYPIMRLAILIGCRIGEATALKWSDIEWDTGLITIRRSQDEKGKLGPPKGKKIRTTALGREGLAFLRGHRAAMERLGWRGCDEWCFPRPENGRDRPHDRWPYSTVAKRVRRTLVALGIDLDTCTHLARHTHVTEARKMEAERMASLSAPSKELRDGIGHADAKTTEVYTDESVRRVAAVGFASQLEGRIGGALGGAEVVDIANRSRK
jgi:integrase